MNNPKITLASTLTLAGLSSSSAVQSAEVDNDRYKEAVMSASVRLNSGRRVGLDQRKVLNIEADDGFPVDEHHVDAAADGGSINEINARLRACPRPARATEQVLISSSDPEVLAALFLGRGVLETSTGACLEVVNGNHDVSFRGEWGIYIENHSGMSMDSIDDPGKGPPK